MPRRRRQGQHRTAAVGCALLLAATACAVPDRPTAATGSDAPQTQRDSSAPDDAAEQRRGGRQGFTLVASGDILPHDAIIEQARKDAGGRGFDFRPMLAAARPLAHGADLSICHMETVYAAPRGPFTGYPAFRTPPQIAGAIRATGYDSCSTASNHTLDAGPAGVTRTLNAMDAAGLRHSGSARSAAERAAPPLLRAGGATVAHLAYTYGTNVGADSRGIPLDAARPWLVNRTDPVRILRDARAARRAGADVVVLSMHWGTEWQEQPDDEQLELAQQLTAARDGGRRVVDLILGTHAHVPQAYEKVNGTWVVYGMGDQLAGEMSDPRGSMGSTARFAFAPPSRRGGEWRVRAAEFTPHLVVAEPDFRLVDLTEVPKVSPDERARYIRARNLITRAVLARGAAEDGLRAAR
ncbi:CapA family protein [Streptomyces sp. XM4193]|uniref:CapA family protein n=1 Tax=Streptomyces sp. XM4193 TaxID=2929782 RepID=UPI001FFA78CE|nr:CapA family protein [Streptomyces sp. XM4193]MCK1796451.1 CapA family protein [Streptomyces sp. XM4193]